MTLIRMICFLACFQAFLIMNFGGLSTAAERLTFCSYSKENPKNDDRWFYLGQLYSFCMQYGNLGNLFDAGCSAAKCQECVKSCPGDGVFELQNCISTCNSSTPCIEGCRFFNQINGTGEGNVTIENNSRPLVTNKNITTHERKYQFDFQWESIFSSGVDKLNSIYLVTITVLSSPGKWNVITGERVLFLTTSRSYNQTIDDICDKLPEDVSFASHDKISRINVYPINYHGFDRLKPMQSPLTRKDLPEPKMTIRGPYSDPLYTNAFNWEVTPINSDPKMTSFLIYSAWVTECRKYFQLAFADFREQNGKARIFWRDPGKDQLDGCTNNIEVTWRYRCLSSPQVTKAVLTYLNCSTVENYPNACPYVEPTTFPPDENVDDNGLAVLNKVTCNKRMFHQKGRRLSTKCESGNYNLYLTWIQPKTYTPIMAYQIKWGKLSVSPLGKGLEWWRILSSDGQKALSSTIRQLSISNIDMEKEPYAIQVHARTKRSSFRPASLKHQLIVYYQEQKAAAIPLTIRGEAIESCSSWSYVACFQGDSEKRCENCTNGEGIRYHIRWELRNATNTTNVIDTTAYDEYVVRWGSSVSWGKAGDILPHETSSLVTLAENLERSYVIVENMLHPDFAVQVHARNASDSIVPIYTSNYHFINFELKVFDVTIQVLNFTCTNRTIDYDNHGGPSEECEGGRYDLMVSWKKTLSNRTFLGYMIRWGGRNPRQVTNEEALVLKEDELGRTETQSTYQAINGISLQNTIGIEIQVKTRLYNDFHYSPNEEDYTWFEDKTPQFNPQNITIQTKLLERCHEYQEVECFSGEKSRSCVQCVNSSVVYQADWEFYNSKINRMRRSVNNETLFTVRWGAEVKYKGVGFIPFDSELGRITASSGPVTFNITKIHPNMGIQVFAHTGDLFSVFGGSYKFVQIPPLVPKPPPISGPVDDDDKTTTITLAVLIPILVIVLAVLLFFYCSHRNKPKQGIWEDNYAFRAIYSQDMPLDMIADEWEIDPRSITLDNKIGEGAFGTVYGATIDAVVFSKSKYAKLQGNITGGFKIEGNPKIAVKLLKEGAGQDEWADFKEEITLMKNIGYHKNIVNMIGCSVTTQPICLVVEYMKYGDLLNYLRKRRTKLCAAGALEGNSKSFMYTQQFQDTLQTTTSTGELVDAPVYDDNTNPEDILTPEELLSFAYQIASGMEYLTMNNMVHRDLAARNILVGDNKVVKVSDFGLTRQVGTDQVYMSKKSRKLPIKWMSVEAIFNQEFTAYGDVWAYGIVLFEIVTLGGTPYPSISNKELLPLLKSGYRMDKPENCADPMYDIMLHCWNEDALQRPTFTDLHEHIDQIMTQSADYFSFDIDQENTYYNVASFNSVPSDDEDFEIFDGENEVNVKSIDELKKEAEARREEKALEEKKLSLSDDNRNEEDERYVTPQPLIKIENNKLGNGYINAGVTNDYSTLTL